MLASQMKMKKGTDPHVSSFLAYSMLATIIITNRNYLSIDNKKGATEMTPFCKILIF